MRRYVLIFLSGIAGGGAAQEGAVTNLPPIVVEATAISKYRVEQAESARLPFRAEESPQVVDVLTEDFIRDRNPSDLDNLLSFQPGVYTGGKTLLSRTAGQYTMRGLSGSQVLLNGVVPMSAGMGTFMDPALLDRVELPKGPVGSVYGGQGGVLGPYGAGGAVVVYQKRARSDSEFGSAELRSSLSDGGGQCYRLLGDVNGAVAGEWLWMRLPLGVDLSRPSWLPGGYAWGQGYTLAPSLLLEGDGVRAGVDTSVSYSDRPGYQGISVFRGRPRATGPGAPYGWDTSLSLRDMRDDYLGVTVLPWVEVDVTEALTLRAGGGLAWNFMDYDHVGPSSGIPTAAAPYEACTGDFIARNYNAYLHAVYRLEAGPVAQTLAGGVDWTQQGRTGKSAFQSVAAPVFIDRGTLESTATRVEKYGAFVEDSLEWGGLRAVLGLRYDDYRSGEGNRAGAWGPRAGVAYLVTPWLIPFANVTLTSAPNFGNPGEDGRELTDSWTAVQCEGGLRVAPVNDFWVTASAFRIGQDKTPLSTSGSPNGPFVSDGKTVSQGIELSAVGNLRRNWSVYAAWAFIDFDDKNSGQKYDRFPPHAVSLFTTYKIEAEDTPLDGTVLGFGYRFRDGFDQTTRGQYQGADYRVDGYSVFDASVEWPLPKSWHLGDASLSLALKNILNRRYVESARNMQCFVGDPRTFELALRFRF
ncbi:MAG: TonB-dependent receptor [Kiritimatiellaeota bacterium]|nr:TonB-dependent receptor [Kiritimatiellota bacterium]